MIQSAKVTTRVSLVKNYFNKKLMKIPILGMFYENFNIKAKKVKKEVKEERE